MAEKLFTVSARPYGDADVIVGKAPFGMLQSLYASAVERASRAEDRAARLEVELKLKAEQVDEMLAESAALVAESRRLMHSLEDAHHRLEAAAETAAENRALQAANKRLVAEMLERGTIHG